MTESDYESEINNTVPPIIAAKAIALDAQSRGVFGVKVKLPLFSGANTHYEAESAEARTTGDNLKSAYLKLRDDLFHIGILLETDMNIENITITTYRSYSND